MVATDVRRLFLIPGDSLGTCQKHAEGCERKGRQAESELKKEYAASEYKCLI